MKFFWHIHYITEKFICKVKTKKISRFAVFLGIWEIFCCLMVNKLQFNGENRLLQRRRGTTEGGG